MNIKRIKLIALCLLLFFANVNLSFGQGQWVWVKGAQNGVGVPTYGTLGVGAPGNEPPEKYQASFWTDSKGDFWVFGGGGIATSIISNDLWKYNIANNEWTWMHGPQGATNTGGNYGTQGVSSPLNLPPARRLGSNCWTDDNDNLWLFGGLNDNFQWLDDLWKYDPNTNEWTWMAGSSVAGQLPQYGSLGVPSATNTPGGRVECKSAWFYQDKLYMFGGQDQSGDTRNDMWGFDIAIGQWAWVAGSNTPNHPGNFGTLGVPAASNEPPARWSYSKWMSKDHFYLFAGGDNSQGPYNDVWSFDPQTNIWTWISGTNIDDDPGNFGALCEPSATYSPSSRVENQTAISLTTCATAFWTFGGFSEGSFGYAGSLNDLWIFDVTNLEWILVNGDPTGTQNGGSYGTMGVPNNTNIPPARGGVCIWTDQDENLWIYGGLDAYSGSIIHMDLWKFTPDTACFNIKAANLGGGIIENATICEGDTVQLTIPTGTVFNSDNTADYQYDAVSGDLFFFPSTSTIFNWTIQSGNPSDPCTLPGSGQLDIVVNKGPEALINVTPNSAGIANPNFVFSDASNNADNIEWLEGGMVISTAASLSKNFNALGDHCLQLAAHNSCASDTTESCVKVLPEIHIPNAFSPNGDGKNDLFKILSRGDLDLLTFDIFNRWGQKVFSTNDFNAGWDGKFKGGFCEPGVYFYYIEVDAGEDVAKYRGDITLIR